MKTLEYFRSLDIPVRSYSGRGMFGRVCWGFVTSSNHQFSSVGDVFAHIIETVDDIDEDDYETRNNIAKSFREMREDGMGLGTIHYFPYEEWDNGDNGEGGEN